MTRLVVRLPLPDKRLSPNARAHWAVKSIAARAARHDGWLATMMVRNGYESFPEPSRIPVALHFIMPTARRRDTDNLFAGCKAYLDGVADALGVDDSRFDFTITREVRKGEAAVVLTIGGAE